MNQTGVFQWIREGVRRAVLLGFSDAVEQLGEPATQMQLHPQLAGALREGAMKQLEVAPVNVVSNQRPARKRLGRSLNDNAS
jgi:hypothetical protein